MLTNPKLGQEVIYTSRARKIFYKRAIVVRVEGAWAVKLKEDGDVFFVEIDDEIDGIRGT